MINAMIIDEKDNVAVVIEPVKKAVVSMFPSRNKRKTISFACVEDVRFITKSPSRDIPAECTTHLNAR